MDAVLRITVSYGECGSHCGEWEVLAIPRLCSFLSFCVCRCRGTSTTTILIVPSRWPFLLGTTNLPDVMKTKTPLFSPPSADLLWWVPMRNLIYICVRLKTKM